MTDAAATAEKAAELFPRIYHALCARVRAGQYLPSPQTLAILQHLARSGPLTVTEAARHFGRVQSAMSELVDHLEEKHLLARIKDTRDRRRTLVWLTEEGHDVLSRAQKPLSDELLATAVAAMREEDRAQLIQGMRALVDAAEKISTSRGK